MDGIRIGYSLAVQAESSGETRTFAVTDYSRMYKKEVQDTRISISADELQVGQEVQVWGRFASNHVVEASQVEVQ